MRSFDWIQRLPAKSVRVLALLCVFALTGAAGLLCSPSTTTAAAALEASPNKMKWEDAKAYCASKGGRLPLIGGKQSITSASPLPDKVLIDGFGPYMGPWPAGLPADSYWTGTELSDATGNAWIIVEFGARVTDMNADKANAFHRAACVK